MGNHLDISIKSVEKYLTTQKKKDAFFKEKTIITQKTDGVKLTVIKTNNTGTLDDYIFSYKGNILYPGEFDYLTNDEISKYSIGASQFNLVFEHFRNIGKNNIPVNTELFIEFLMNKPTLMSNYSKPHQMVLLAYSLCNYECLFGKLTTKETTFQETKVVEYANELGLDTPRVLFDGTLNNFEYGIKDDELLQQFNDCTRDLTNIENIKDLLLSVQSIYGGDEEGVVLSFDDIKLKFVQSYQHDKELRHQVKMKFREDNIEDETKYWSSIKRLSNELVDDISGEDLITNLHVLSEKIKQTHIRIKHTKKDIVNIKDDLQLTSKLKLIKKLPGNNNALILGKFRVLTIGHLKMINQALSNYDNVVICLITSKDTKPTKQLRYDMLRTVFPEINIIHSQNGNLVRILQKSPININTVVAGTDRVQTYSDQLKQTDINVEEVKRCDVSATDVIKHIQNYEYFLKLTPIKVHDFYSYLKDTYG